MRAAYATKLGGDVPLDNLEVGERPRPVPGRGEALVRVQAVSLNHHDLWTLRGVSGAPVTLPRILGCEAAAIVEEYGPDQPSGAPPPGAQAVLYPVIADSSLPDETLAPGFGMLSDKVDGTLAEYVVLPARNVLAMPEDLSVEETACLGTTYLTGYRMLFTKARVRPGDAVLIPGASGGVATALIQMAKAAGLLVIVTSRDEAKRQAALDIGAHYAIETGRGSSRQVLALTDGRGVDAVMETVGEPTWSESLRALRPGGCIVVSGATGGSNPPADLGRVFWRQLDIRGSTMGTLDEMKALLRFVKAAKLHPVLDQTFGLEDIRAALTRMQEGSHTGKIIVKP